MNGGEFFIVLASMAIGTSLLFYVLSPLRRALMRKADAVGAGAGNPQLEHRVEDLQDRVLELEERLDFAERLLAQSREQSRLASPSGE